MGVRCTLMCTSTVGCRMDEGQVGARGGWALMSLPQLTQEVTTHRRASENSGSTLNRGSVTASSAHVWVSLA
jgi:hypothetical protein